jgi:predicted Zn-dependent peptidase
VRSKEHVKGRMVLGLESSGARMTRCARSVLFGVELLSLDELLSRVDAVTREDVAALAEELYDPARLSAACIGAEESCFRKAAGSVSPALAA